MADEKQPIEELSEKMDADFFFYTGAIRDEDVEEFWESVSTNRQRKNVALILTTYGGSADAAYRIARRLRTHYERFSLYVFGSCKSAGTLLACGAHEVILSVRGELGPLDVQLAKRDELFGRASGLDISRSLEFITEQSFRIFEDHFLKLIERSDGALSTKTASEISKAMCVGLLAPITQQIDPMQLGEIHRAMNVAYEYGRRLDVDDKTLRKLISNYPAHGFVIDLEEAKSLFREVRAE
jgi:hypothetical protein